MTKPIYPPKHLNDREKAVYKQTVKLMRGLKVHHPGDDILIEQHAVLVTRARQLNAQIDTAENPLKVLASMNTCINTISRLSRQLGIARDTRAEHSRAEGRPRKNAKLTAKPDDTAAWDSVLKFGT